MAYKNNGFYCIQYQQEVTLDFVINVINYTRQVWLLDTERLL